MENKKIVSNTTFLFITLILISSFFSLYKLGSTPLIDYDEATYAQVLKESIARENYLSFTYLQNNWFEKPPLYFWLSTVSVKIFGMNEFAMRAPAALFIILTSSLVFLFTLFLTKSPITAFISGIVLVTTGSFLDAGRQMRFDVPVAFFILFSLFSYIKAINEKPLWYIFMGVSLALGVLMKSVIGFLAIPIILIFSLVYKEWRWIKSKYFWFSILISTLIILPWHVYEWINFGSAFWQSYLGVHVFKRLGTNLLGGEVTTWTYIKNLLLYTEPWILVFIGGVAWFSLNFKKNKEALKPHLALILSIFFIFIFFSISNTKLFYYLIPIYPLMAIFIALLFHRMYEMLFGLERKVFIGISILCIFIGLISATYVGHHVSDNWGLTALSKAEKNIGLEIKKEPQDMKVYAFKHYFWETIRYYSGGRKIEEIDRDMPRESFLLISQIPIIEVRNRKIITLYTDPSLSLYKIE